MSQDSYEWEGPSPEEKTAEVSAEVKTWHFDGLKVGPLAAVNFANAAPAQVAGEAVFSVREDGKTYTFTFR